MNLYLISQNVNTGWDTYQSAVVSAKNENEAKSIHPRFGLNWNGENVSRSGWSSIEDVEVQLIGETSLYNTPTIIITDFKNG